MFRRRRSSAFDPAVVEASSLAAALQFRARPPYASCGGMGIDSLIGVARASGLTLWQRVGNAPFDRCADFCALSLRRACADERRLFRHRSAAMDAT
jgi:hypothetical protein